jgi:flagellar biosynthesis GTPase FlhF
MILSLFSSFMIFFDTLAVRTPSNIRTLLLSKCGSQPKSKVKSTSKMAMLLLGPAGVGKTTIIR